MKWIKTRPSGRKIISDLWGNKVRTLLVVASIAVGVFAVGMIGGAFFIIPQDMNSSFASANPANIKITTDPFDEDFLSSIKRVEGIEDAQAVRTVSVSLYTGSNNWTNFDLTAFSDFSPQQIDAQLHLEGAQQPGDNQVILEMKTADSLHAHIGDVLQIELSDGTTRDLPVVGIAEDLTSGVGGMMNNKKGYITYDTIKWLHAPEYYNQLLVTVKDRPNDLAYIQQVNDQIKDKLDKSSRGIYTQNQYRKNQHPMDSILQALLRILLILGVLIVFLSGSLISNTLSALLTQHLPQIGIMKLVGARSSQIVSMYIALILAYGVIAMIIAVPLGALAAYALSAFAASLIGFPLSGFRVIPASVAVQVLVSLAVPLLAGTPPVVNGSRITVHKAITMTSSTSGGAARKTHLDHWLARLRGVSRPLLISIRNTFRRKGRLALTLFTLTLGGAIFISVFNVQVSLNTKINQISNYFGADVNLDFSRNYSVLEIESILQGVPGVKEAEPWVLTRGELIYPDGTVENTTTLIAPPIGSTLVVPNVMQGRWIQPGDTNSMVVNEAFLRKYPNLKVGDSLKMRVGTRESDWQIVGIFQFSGFDELVAYSHYDYLSQVLNQTNRATSFRIVSEDHGLEAQKKLAATLDGLFRDQGYHVNNVEAGGEFVKTMTDYISILTAFLVIMAILTAVVGSIGMTGTLSMNVMERTREIGVLRAIGAHDGVVMKLVLIEGLLIGGISFALSTVLSFPITSVLSEVISQAIFGSPASFVFTIQGFAIWFAVVLLLSTLASLIPARSASKMTIREVLSYE